MSEGVLWYVNILWEVCVSLCMVFYYIFKSWIQFFYVPPKSLKDEVVVLTGAAGGFGSLLAKKLAQKGCVLALLDINEEDLNRLADELNIEGGNEGDREGNNQGTTQQKAYPFKCDITKKEEVARVSQEIVAQMGHPTILINNAGILSGKYFMDMSVEEVVKTFEVNTFAHYYTVKEFLPHMVEHNHGHIVSVSSILGMDAVAGVADYGPSKSAATAFMHSLRQEVRLLGKDQVYFTNVLPYKADTLLFRGIGNRFKYFPLLETQNADHVTNKIIDAIEKNQVTVYIPRILYFCIALMHVMPDRAFDYLYDFLHVNQAMKTYVGRGKDE